MLCDSDSDNDNSDGQRLVDEEMPTIQHSKQIQPLMPASPENLKPVGDVQRYEVRRLSLHCPGSDIPGLEMECATPQTAFLPLEGGQRKMVIAVIVAILVTAPISPKISSNTQQRE